MVHSLHFVRVDRRFYFKTLLQCGHWIEKSEGFVVGAVVLVEVESDSADSGSEEIVDDGVD